MKLISWNTTNQCNMRCEHCYRRANETFEGLTRIRPPEDELTTAEARQMILEIKKAGFQIMIFSGGEPMMRHDLFELGAFAKQIGLRPVLGTNATLITEKIAFKLKEAGFIAAGVSLDSLDPEKLADFRKLPNCLERVLQGIENLKKAGIHVQIHTTIMNWNLCELEAITDFAVEIGAMSHHFFFLVPTGRAVQMKSEQISDTDYEKAVRWIMKKQKTVPIELKPTCAPQFMRVADQIGLKTRFSRGCLAGISYCIISPNGDVRPCAYLNNTLGNVKEIEFDKIWNNHPSLKLLRTEEVSGKCGQCKYKHVCGGCRARAFYETGDYMGEDPNCLYQPRGESDKDGIRHPGPPSAGPHAAGIPHDCIAMGEHRKPAWHK